MHVEPLRSKLLGFFRVAHEKAIAVGVVGDPIRMVLSPFSELHSIAATLVLDAFLEPFMAISFGFLGMTNEKLVSIGMRLSPFRMHARPLSELHAIAAPIEPFMPKLLSLSRMAKEETITIRVLGNPVGMLLGPFHEFYSILKSMHHAREALRRCAVWKRDRGSNSQSQHRKQWH